MRKALLLFIAFAAVFSACRRDRVFEGKATLEFSSDTVFFDTVFTTIGSITERIKVYNPYDKTLEINHIYVENGAGSNFKLNVDGVKGQEVRDVQIAPFDSIFVFVEVTVDPNGGNTPMILEEDLVFVTDQNTQQVKMVAWGQDAYFYPSISFGDANGDGFGDPWELPTDKPIVFYGYSIVDTGAVLTIPCGAQVHFHANSGLIVGHQASLQIIGCQEDPVVIQGDRLEDFFEEGAGQWGQLYGGIYLTQTSIDNYINHAIIKNGTVGIIVDSNTNENPTLTIENTQILNMSYSGIIGQDARIEGNNLVVANCGDHAVALRYGGRYDFNHCTFANYWSGNPRSRSVLLVNNYFEVGGKTYVRDLVANFENTIVYGNLDEEVNIDMDDSEAFDYFFDHCVLKRDTTVDDPLYFSSIVLNPTSPIVDGQQVDPLFKDVSEDFKLSEVSRAKDVGKVTALMIDIEGNARDASPDIGAYEYVPE
ncbi:MAG: right-handed parallel beta-helix repeat-containing protein [Flavobacteriales bacterium]|nr:right-handed parallel beta-helix repeat-containing protein [Flavobacteriales bacterium]